MFKEQIKHLNEPDLVSFKYQYKENNLVQIENIFEECYELDNNENPARYRLKYLNRLFPNFNQKVKIKFRISKLN